MPNICKPDSNSRSILKNPKEGQKITVQTKIQNGLITPLWEKKINKFFHSLIPPHIKNEHVVFIDTIDELSEFLDKLKNPDLDLSNIKYVCLPLSITYIYDIVDFLICLKKKLPQNAKLIYLNFNWIWAAVFKLFSLLGFTRRGVWGNFYRDEDLDCFLNMSGWENVQKMKRYLVPFEINFIGAFFDNLVRLPLLSVFAINTVFIARMKLEDNPVDSTVSILIPCKNEEKNIEAIIKRTPLFGKSLELIFINDKSTDGTESRIIEAKRNYPEKNIKLVQGPGLGKGNAVREAMKSVTGDVCMILDADLSIIPEDLVQFYDAMILRRADFLHGTRLVYPQEDDAMRTANILGNIFFSLVFSYILDQRVTDTLCGTKVFWKEDWPVFEHMRTVLSNSDVWGDYNLIFGAARYGLKIGELPVRYFQRLEGITKMTKRIKNGLIMLRVAYFALWKVKFFN